MDILYTASATAEGGREGKVRSSDGVLELDLAMPKEFGGGGGRATNPEQLFAAGYAACFVNALRRAAREAKLSAEGARVTAHVGIGRTEATRFGLTATLDVEIPDLPRESAEALVRAAHEEICPYSNAVRGNVEVEARLV